MHQLNVANDIGVNVNSYTDCNFSNSQCMIEMQIRDNESEPHTSSKLTFSATCSVKDSTMKGKKVLTLPVPYI